MNTNNKKEKKIPKELRKKIKLIITKAFQKKIENYKPETKQPVFTRALLGEKVTATFSFTHSLNTTIGMSCHEPIAKVIAEDLGGFKVEKQYEILGVIDNKTETLIRSIYQGLESKKRTADYKQDLNQIKKSVLVAKQGQNLTYPDRTADLFLKKGNKEYYIDVTSPKGNKKEFQALKQKLLRWAALRYSTDKKVEVFPHLAMAYNPYHPKPFSRFSAGHLFDFVSHEILVQDKFWSFLSGGKNIYDDLVEVYQEVGSELKKELDKRIDSLI